MYSNGDARAAYNILELAAATVEKGAVDGAIVGFRRPDQVAAIVHAANLDLTDDDVAEIEGAPR